MEGEEGEHENPLKDHLDPNKADSFVEHNKLFAQAFRSSKLEVNILRVKLQVLISFFLFPCIDIGCCFRLR